MDDYIQETNIKGVFILKRPTYSDTRGFFREVYRQSDLEAKLGHQFIPVQSNHSRSKKGVLRGIHKAPWDKLVTIMRGTVQQIVVDLRQGSETFGKYESIIISDENEAAIFIPANCGNAFLTLSENADYNYLVTDYWEAGKEVGIIYNDPDLDIKWQMGQIELSDKDKQNQTLKEMFPNR